MKELLEAYDICKKNQEHQDEKLFTISRRDFLSKVTKKDLEQIRTGIFMFYPQEVFDCRPDPYRQPTEGEQELQEWAKQAYQLITSALKSICIKNYSHTSEERQITHIMAEMFFEKPCSPSEVAKEIESRRTVPTMIV